MLTKASSCWTRAHNEEGEEQAMPQVGRVQLVEGVQIEGRPDEGAARWRYQQERDEALYEEAWFVDFRARWRAALGRARTRFLVLLDAVGRNDPERLLAAGLGEDR